jgi:nucleoside phosphorylase
LIGVFAALQPEVEACPLSLRSDGGRRLGHFLVLQGRDGFVCRTGTGRVAEEAAQQVIGTLRPSVVLSVGTAGGLGQDLKTGDIVICRSLNVWTDGRGDESATVESDGGLLSAAQAVGAEAGLPMHTGTSVTADHVAWGADEKRRLHEWMGHDIVEMESFWVGRAALRMGLPFLAIRVVSDAHTESLPQVPDLISADGAVDGEALVAHARDHPEVLASLSEFYKRSVRALDGLRAFLDAFLPAIQEVPR